MLKKLLEGRVGHLSNSEFSIICEIVTDDIKFNRISFKKRTSLDHVLDIAERRKRRAAPTAQIKSLKNIQYLNSK